MSMTSESDERMMPNNGVDSPSMDDANSGGNVGPNVPLKKGPWTTAEDSILQAYVLKHGEGNWNAVQKHSGLARCGKSCRLRWANHLRPDLKKGAFTPEEERRIIELHSKIGNRWARMAAELPGRTDNEIKNFWNTRVKRRQRAGLPLYPPEICRQSPNENQVGDDNMNTFSSGSLPHPDFMPGVNNNLHFPSVEFIEFKGLQFNRHIHPQALIDMPAGAGLLDIPTSSLQGFDSSYHQPKRFRGESLFPSLNLNPPIGNAFTSDCSMQIDYSMPSGLIPDGHVVLNSNHSSGPAWATKIELPSLQTQMGNGGSPPSSSSPLPFFESVDVLIQTPPTENTHNSGLLEEVLYESETMKNSIPNVFSHGSNVENDIIEKNSARVFSETKWDASDEQLSPFGHSTSSVFSESNPITPISGNSLDEPRLAENLPVKEKASNLVPMQHLEKDQTTNQMIFTRPDYLLASNCISPLNHPTDDHSLLENAMGKLIGDDLSRDCKQMDTGTSSSAQGRARNSCAWNAMPTV